MTGRTCLDDGKDNHEREGSETACKRDRAPLGIAARRRRGADTGRRRRRVRAGRRPQGQARIELSKVAREPSGPAPAFYRIAELYFTSKAQIDKVVATPAAKQTVADLPNFATGGFTVLVSEIA